MGREGRVARTPTAKVSDSSSLWLRAPSHRRGVGWGCQREAAAAGLVRKEGRASAPMVVSCRQYMASAVFHML